MANQIIIDIGAVANDGTGDPLRTAFGYVNDNFSNIWSTGVANSNVAFSGNKIITVNTNGNLILAPNGVGKVVANVDIVPNTANTRNLGALTNRWSTVYSQYLNVSNDVDFTGDVTINGNLTVEGDTIQIGNIVTDTKTIQLANTASTANAANGSGITVGANDNIATMLYNSTSNTWVMNVGANITGNITAPYFIGNGSQLTGITSYANANAVAYGQAGWAGNIIPATSNTYSLGNATNQWNDLYVSNATIYMNNVPIGLTAGNVLTVDGEPVLVNDSNTSITTTGNITADTFFGSGVTAAAANDVVSLNAFDTDGNTVSIQAQGNTSQAVIETYFEGANNRFTWSFDNSGTLTFPRSQTSIFGGYDNDLTINTSNANVGTAYTFTFSQFGNLSVPVNLDVSGNVYTNDIVGPAAGNVAITANTQSWLFDNNGTLTLPGNSQILPAGNTGVRLSAGAADVTGLFLNNAGDAEMYANANVSIYADSANSGQGWTFDTTGNLILPAGGDLNFVAGGIAQTVDEDFTILVQDGDDDGFSVYLNVDDGSGTVLSQYQQQRDQFELGFPSTSKYFQFNDDGTAWMPGNIHGAYGESMSIQIPGASASSSVSLRTIDNTNTLRSNITVDVSNVTISTGTATYNWLFDINGVLTTPGDIHLGNGVAAVEYNAGGNRITITSDTANNRTGASFTLNADANVYANANVRITSDSGTSAKEWLFDNTGNLTIPKNILGPNNGNPIVIDAGVTGDSLISIPSFTDGGEQLVIKNAYYGSQGIRIQTETGNFILSGNNLTFPDSTVQTTAYTGSTYGDSNVTTLLSSLGANTISGTGNITTTANISGGYVLGNAAFMTGIPASYGNANVADFLDSLGSNAIVTTGNISGGNILASGYANITGNVNGSGATFSGNVTAANFEGNITITGNVTGTSANVTLVAGSYSYTFDNAGTLTLPTGSSGNEGGEISFTQAANSTLAGNTVIVDQYIDKIRFFESGGNTRGAYIDLAQAADGVGTLLNNRVSGFVNAGTFVTMDNIKATVTTTGNRGLSIAAVSGSYGYMVSGTYGASGGASGASSTTDTLTTTPTTSLFGWSFLAQGDAATYLITNTNSLITYRITMQINASFNNNMISIERLV